MAHTLRTLILIHKEKKAIATISYVTMNKDARSPWVAGQVNFDYSSHETQLIKRARRGHLSSFNRLVYTYQERVYRFAYRVLGDADAADQAARQSFALACRHFDGFRGDSLAVWLLRIVARACREQQHAKQPLLSSSSKILHARSGDNTPGPISPTGSALPPAGDKHALDNILQQGLGALPFEQRVILVLADMEEYSHEQIAAISGIRTDTVQSRLASARMELTRFLAAHEDQLPQPYQRTPDPV